MLQSEPVFPTCPSPSIVIGLTPGPGVGFMMAFPLQNCELNYTLAHPRLIRACCPLL